MNEMLTAVPPPYDVGYILIKCCPCKFLNSVQTKSEKQGKFRRVAIFIILQGGEKDDIWITIHNRIKLYAVFTHEHG